MQYITGDGCLGTGHSAENERRFPVVIGAASGAIPLTATTRPCRGSTQLQGTQPDETVSQAMLKTIKTGNQASAYSGAERLTRLLCANIT